MAAVDLLLSGLFLWLSGKLWVIVLRLPEVLTILVAVNLMGGAVLFAPIRRFLNTGDGEAEAIARAARLGLLTTRWVIVVAALFTFSSFFVTPFILFDVPVTREIVAILVGRALAWIVLLPYVATFVMQEYLRHMRGTLFDEHDIVIPPGQAKLGRKLVLVFLGGAIVPAASIAITLTLVPEISPITGQPRSVVVITTLVGASVALLLAFWATQRSTTAGFRTLLDGMRAMRKGELGTEVVIETDDELGRLAAGFNALSAALQTSKAETEAKEAERAHAAGQFHEAQKRDALGRLAAGIAHDFNNILAIIVMYSETVRKAIETDQKNEKRLREVLTAADRGKELISQILDFTRNKEQEISLFDLAENLRETTTLIGETLAKGVEMSVRTPDAPVWIEGDATGLHQVVLNLCVNAVHAMPGAQGCLRVGLRICDVDGGRSGNLKARMGESRIVYEERGDGTTFGWVGLLDARSYACISVADNGSGMTPGTVRKVFDPYFTTKPVGKGTGLGLAAVAGIVLAHDGGVTVETQPGFGTRFQIFLPITKEGPSNG